MTKAPITTDNNSHKVASADDAYAEAINEARDKFTSVLRHIDNAIFLAGNTLKSLQPKFPGAIGIVWEKQDVGVSIGYSDTPRIVRFKKIRNTWVYQHLTYDRLNLKASSNGPFEYNSALVKETLKGIQELFEKRAEVVQTIAAFRIAASQRHNKSEALIRRIEAQMTEAILENERLNRTATR